MRTINRMCSSLLLAALAVASTGAAFGQQTLYGGTTENSYNTGGGDGYPAYPVPKMVPMPVQPAHIAPPKHHPPLQAAVQHTQPMVQQPKQAPIQQPKPLQASATVNAPPPGVLPTGFMGSWLVLGQRSKVDALPEYQSGIGNIFTASNSQNWNIAGNPGAYSMSSDTGVSSVQVGQCTANTAFVRYRHQIRNTVASEAIVMQLSPDGRSFTGMQRIAIQKPGEPKPRATVTYSLMGQRQ